MCLFNVEMLVTKFLCLWRTHRILINNAHICIIFNQYIFCMSKYFNHMTILEMKMALDVNSADIFATSSISLLTSYKSSSICYPKNDVVRIETMVLLCVEMLPAASEIQRNPFWEATLRRGQHLWRGHWSVNVNSNMKVLTRDHHSLKPSFLVQEVWP